MEGKTFGVSPAFLYVLFSSPCTPSSFSELFKIKLVAVVFYSISKKIEKVQIL